MQAINHTVFGTLIAVSVQQPLLALPLALGSHFVLDAIPHYGDDPQAPRGSSRYNLRILVDGLASLLILLWFLSFHPPHMGLVIACAVLAVLPDFLWPIALYIAHEGPLWAFFRFHKLIQRESRSGIFVEIVWLLMTTSLVVYLIH